MSTAPLPLPDEALDPARRRTLSVRAELRAMVRLALPVVLVQVGIMLMGVVDTIMVGRVSAAALAAVALGNMYFFAVAIVGQGVLMALDPVVAQAVGARDEIGVARGVQRGMVIAVALTAASTALLLPAEPVLRGLRQPAEVVPLAAAFARLMVPGMLPFFGFIVLRQSLQAMGRMRPIVVTIVAANLLNAALDWVLIFGHLGAPPLGVVGSAWATTTSRWVMGLGLLALAWPAIRPHLAPWRRDAWALGPIVRMLRLGIPIGLQYELEYGAFASIGLLMGLLGTVPMAGHQVALNLASLTFMVPLGVSGAAAVLVGRAVGRADAVEARRAAGAALACGAAFMACTALVMLAVPTPLARVYTNDARVVAIAATLIPIAGVFQVFDGLQAVGTGVLRGVGDTRAAMIAGFVGYWLIGIPISAWLGFRTRAGPVGLWWGLVAGLAAVAVFLLVRIRHKLWRREVRRVEVDAGGRAEN
jgi:MATE family multidrug resistance protein